MTELEARPIQGIIVRPGAAEIAARITEDWLDGLPPATRGAYTGDLGHWQAWCDENGTDPLAARKPDVDKWIARMREAAVAKRTIARRVSAAASWYEALRDATDGALPLAPTNPARTKRRPNVSRDNSPTLGLTPQEARQLIAAADADGLRSAALIRMLLGNGFRVSTVTGARIEKMAEDEGHHVIFLSGKGGAKRKVALPPTVYGAVQRMLADRGGPAEGPLFATRTGRPIDRHYVFRLVRRLAGKAGIKAADRLSPHSMRHTFASEAIRKEVPLYQLQNDMWHADPRTTEGYVKAGDGLAKSTSYIVAAGFEPADGGDAP